MKTGITSSSFKILSHPDKDLREHLLNVASTSKRTVEELSVDLSSVDLSKGDLKDLCWIIGACHDYGKATPFFQQYLRETDEKEKARLKNMAETNHAHLSGLFTYHQLKSKFKDHKSPLAELLPLIGYEVVRRHHGNLGNMHDELIGRGEADKTRELNVFKKQNDATDLKLLAALYREIVPIGEIKRFKEKIEKVYQEVRKSSRILRKTRKNGVEASVLTLFCFSVLISMDKEDASGLAVNRNPQDLNSGIVEKYREILGYDKPLTELNKVRNRIYLSAQKRANSISLDKRILSLNMPTGSGKTLTGLNFALKLRERLQQEKGMSPRIIYSVSYISIIDQNSKVFEEAYESVTGNKPSTRISLKHHHLADVLYDSGEDEYENDNLDSLFLVEGWNSETIFTTFVQFFHSVLTNRNRALRKLHRVANSIVLLDEVQSIPYKYWHILRTFLNTFSEFFQTYFIFMTATMPYIFPEDEITEIIDDAGQYHGFFDRVMLYPLLEDRQIEEHLSEVTETIGAFPRKRYLLVYNTVKSSQMAYRYLRERLPGIKLVYLSTMVKPKERLKRINSIREDKGPVVVVSTQLVEAGVDIDMDVVYRDMAPLDSVIQVAGRCNRNFRDIRGEVYLVKLVDDRPFFSYIYGVMSIIVTRTFDVLSGMDCFPEREFTKLTNKFYGLVHKGMSGDISRKILEHLEKMEFESLKEFRLIDEDYPKVDVFVDDSRESGEIWKQYLALRKILDRYKRRGEFMRIKREFLEHMISVPEAYRNKVGWSEDTGLGYISLEEGYYDMEIGFIRDEPTNSTLLI